jgi:hypothetical protein
VIIRRATDRLLLIMQPDHAGLAAEIMTHWHPGGLLEHPRRDAILTATRHHDDGWIEEDAELHINEAGEPLDFIGVPPHVKQRIWPRAAERLASRSPYVAALVAQHALTVHAPLRQEPAWRGFFSLVERTRDALLARAAPHEAEMINADYPFVQIGDQLSLIFCNGWTAPLTGIGYRAILKGIRLEITPDPFGGKHIPLKVHARSIAARAYESAAELRKVCSSAPLLLLEGEAIGA